MRVIVCGGRDFYDRDLLNQTLLSFHKHHPIDLVIQGEARGADSLGKRWAIHNGIKTLNFPANWEDYGNAAGPRRNLQMIREGFPDCTIAFPGGRGTANMIKQSEQHNIPVVVVSENQYTSLQRYLSAVDSYRKRNMFNVDV